MKTAVLIMKRASLAQGLMMKLRGDSDVALFYEPDYANADVAIRGHMAQIALVEVAEDGGCDADYCLSLCAWLRKATPDCRLLLMCPENSEKTVEQAVRAKQRGAVDDFVFYDVSMEYLAAVIRSI